jgi:hypothetical protein
MQFKDLAITAMTLITLTARKKDINTPNNKSDSTKNVSSEIAT